MVTRDRKGYWREICLDVEEYRILKSSNLNYKAASCVTTDAYSSGNSVFLL